MQEYSQDFSLSLLCKLASVSRAGYYKWKNNLKSNRSATHDEVLYPLILDVFNESHRTYGVKRIKQALLHKHGWIVHHKCIRRIIHQYNLVGILSKPKFKRRPQSFGTIGNVLNREFLAEKLLQKLCLDITTLESIKLILNGFIYVLQKTCIILKL